MKMMKIGIIADTHDNQHAIKKAITIFQEEQVNYIFHCGDFIAPFSVKALFKAEIPLRLCFGNNDGEKRIIRKLVSKQESCELGEIVLLEEIKGTQIAMTHGHHSDILTMALSSGNFDVVLSGHIHKKINEKLPNGTLHLNPGEGGGWLTGAPSLAILILDTLEVTFIDIK
jgi:putative phosphoesterase